MYIQYTNRLQSQMEIRDSTPNTGRYTKNETVHQIRDSTPKTGQYTKYGTVHQMNHLLGSFICENKNSSPSLVT